MRGGYTLIEILVALSIVGLLFAFGFVSFRDFSRRQAVTGAADAVRGDLRLAQGNAISGQKPDDAHCGSPDLLNGYLFDVVSPNEYKIEADCTGGTVLTKDVVTPPGISISVPSPNPIEFKVLGQGTNIDSGLSAIITVTQTGTTNTETVTINYGGGIQ